jgi:hypothetical protein
MNQIKGFRMETIGSALYTSLAFLNHSCNSNTIKYFQGDRVFLLATRPIKVGVIITSSVGRRNCSQLCTVIHNCGLKLS